MASFDLVLPTILRFEGGYSFDPRDPGGETNKGVTMAVFRQCSHALLGLEPSSANLKALTDAQAGILYRNLYWRHMQGDLFECQELADIVCDFYVNAGTHATCLLQKVIYGEGGRVICDGCIGAGTLKALHALPQPTVYRLYKAGRIAYYRQLGQEYPEFLPGWLARANAFPDMQPLPLAGVSAVAALGAF